MKLFTSKGFKYTLTFLARLAMWARGGDGSIEVKQAIERIEHLLVTNDVSNV
jgi:hypothetical protein